MSNAEKAVKTSKEIKENTPKGSYTIRYFTRAMRHYKKGFYPLYILLILTMVGLPLIKMFGPKMLIDEIMGNADINTIIRIASVMILLDFLLNTLSCFIGISLEKDYYEGRAWSSAMRPRRINRLWMNWPMPGPVSIPATPAA